MRIAYSMGLLLLTMPGVVFGQDDAKAKALAQDILDRGAAIFDARDADAMAATYLDTAELCLVKSDGSAGGFVVETVRGKAAIKQAYADIFKDRLPEHRARNTVERAQFLDPNVLLIQGRFALDRNQGDAVQFVQIRVHQGEQWRIATLQLVELPK